MERLSDRSSGISYEYDGADLETGQPLSNDKIADYLERSFSGKLSDQDFGDLEELQLDPDCDPVPYQLEHQLLNAIKDLYMACSQKVLIPCTIRTHQMNGRVQRAIRTLHQRLHYDETADTSSQPSKRACLRTKSWIEAAIHTLRNGGAAPIISGLARLVPLLSNPASSPQNPLFGNLETLKSALNSHPGQLLSFHRRSA